MGQHCLYLPQLQGIVFNREADPPAVAGSTPTYANFPSWAPPCETSDNWVPLWANMGSDYMSLPRSRVISGASADSTLIQPPSFLLGGILSKRHHAPEPFRRGFQ